MPKGSGSRGISSRGDRDGQADVHIHRESESYGGTGFSGTGGGTSAHRNVATNGVSRVSPSDGDSPDAPKVGSATEGGSLNTEGLSDSESSALGAAGGGIPFGRIGRALGRAAGSIGFVAFQGGRTAAAKTFQTFRKWSRRLFAAFVRAGSWLSGAMGGFISPKVATAAVSGVSGILTLTLVMTGWAVLHNDRRPAGVPLQCNELLGSNAGEMQTGSSSTDDGGPSDTNAEIEKNAKLIYSVLKEWGMSDEGIAGILGNWTTESHLDPTSVETIFDEPYRIGPKKKKIQDGNFSVDFLPADYRARFPALDHGALGVGYGGWTFERNNGPDGLQEFAQSHNGDWYDGKIQLAFFLQEKSKKEYLEGYRDKKWSNPEEAGANFLKYWEGGGTFMLTDRAAHAKEWYIKMKSWSPDKSEAKSVLDLAETEGRAADSKAAQKNIEACPQLSQEGGTAGGNADAAEAMATYSWPHINDGAGNNGTELYQYLHKEIFPGDPYFMSCDRGVATAVRWSGTDDTIPPGPTSAQWAYFNGEGRDKWEKVLDDAQPADATNGKLKPGDILITHGDGHVWMFLGNEIVREVFGKKGIDYDKQADGARASFGENSPELNHAAGSTEPGGRSFAVFRAKGGDKGGKYKDIDIPSNISDKS